jgi:hypothetical protein
MFPPLALLPEQCAHFTEGAFRAFPRKFTINALTLPGINYFAVFHGQAFLGKSHKRRVFFGHW